MPDRIPVVEERLTDLEFEMKKIRVKFQELEKEIKKFARKVNQLAKENKANKPTLKKKK